MKDERIEAWLDSKAHTMAASMEPADDLCRRLMYVAELMNAAKDPSRHGPHLLYRDVQGVVTAAPVPVDGLVLGRGAGCTIVSKDRKISKCHFTLQMSGGVMMLEDFNSTNGTYINNARVTGRALVEGDIIQAGSQVFVYVVY